jgi:hypothetical protein
MINISIKGGLGNQLFQYAFAKKISFILKENICLDLSWFFLNNFQQVYKLNNFKLINKCNYKNISLRYLFENYFANKIYKKLYLSNYRKYRFEEAIDYIPNYEKIFSKKNTYIMGYFQNVKYFDDIKVSLKKDFILNIKIPEIIKKKIKTLDSKKTCLIHLRRQHGTNPLENLPDAIDKFNNNKKDYLYYTNAIQYVKKRNKKIKFYLVSDVVNDFTNKIAKACGDYEYINFSKEFGNDLLEWEFMRSFSNYILANSTFSWWAAYLSHQKNLLVILPKDNYFKNKTPDFPDSIKL